MTELTRRKTEPFTPMLSSRNAASGGLLWVVLAMVLAAGAVSVACPSTMPWSFLALAGGAILVYWSIKWDVTPWAWIWLLSYGLLEWPQWRIEITGFFNMTVPRFIFIGAVFVFSLHFLLRRERLRYDRAVLWAMLALLVYSAVSATAAGWLAGTAEVKTLPYYRFLGMFLLPFIMFFCVYNTTRDEKQIPRVLVFLSLYGWYALYIGYLQYAAIMGAEGARAFIWPAYINWPAYGIHFERARGAFSSAYPQGSLLVLMFFVNLFLIRRIRGPYRTALIIQAVLIPPAIFFTGVRASYLSFILCGIVWCLWGNRERFGKIKLTLASLVVIIGVAMTWANLAQSRRATGGIAQKGPIVTRQILLERSWELFKERPLTGVGFGHFVDAVLEHQWDPGTMSAMTSGILVEHNLFLNTAVEMGLLGLTCLIVVFLLIYRQSRQLYRRLPATSTGWLSKEFVVLFWIVLLNYFTDAMFRDMVWHVIDNGFFWAIAGLMVGYNRLLDSREQNQPELSIATPAGN
ncbi:MAG: O-antigen ligase family protein [Phycisphaerae bacterium]|nr:O-antigen ligase family protein [Phycisphaerae bacterium]